MKTRLHLLIILILLVGCRASPTPVPGGVEGQVFIGPTCPVEQANLQCDDKPYQANLTILSEDGRKLSSVRSREDGSFELALLPGGYILHPEMGDGIAHAADQPFTVLEGQYTRLTVQYDSGIR